MRKFLLIALMMLAATSLALAKDFPKWEVFGGYSLLKADLDNNQSIYSLLGTSEYQFLTGTDPGYVHGFEVSVARNLNSWLGAEGSFSGHFGKYDTNSNNNYSNSDDSGYSNSETDAWSGNADYRRYTALFGPQFSFRRNSRVRPFAHALLGFSRMTIKNISVGYLETDNYSGGDSTKYVGKYSGSIRGNTAFAMALGGGLDIKASKHASIRLVQLDYLPTFNKINADITYSETVYDNGNNRGSSQRTRPDRLGSNRFNNMKLSFGIVFNF
jgi:hypothetical protein